MRKSRFSGLGSVMRGQVDHPAIKAGATPVCPPDEEDGDVEESEAGDGSKEKEKSMADETNEAIAQAAADATTKANARFNAVLASEHFAGNEALAKSLLATDLSAEQINASLAVANKPAAAAADTVDAEAAARDEVKKVLAETGNSDIEANGSGNDKADKTKAASASWDKAYARAFPNSSAK